MNCSIALIFDDESQNKINSIKEKLKELNIPIKDGINHITIATYTTDRIELLKTKVKDYSNNIKLFNIVLNEIDFFNENNTIYISPIKDENLINLYKDFLNYMSEFNDYITEYYNYDNWIPHCTIANKISKTEFDRAKDILKDYNFLFRTKIKEIKIL